MFFFLFFPYLFVCLFALRTPFVMLCHYTVQGMSLFRLPKCLRHFFSFWVYSRLWRSLFCLCFFCCFFLSSRWTCSSGSLFCVYGVVGGGVYMDGGTANGMLYVGAREWVAFPGRTWFENCVNVREDWGMCYMAKLGQALGS